MIQTAKRLAARWSRCWATIQIPISVILPGHRSVQRQAGAVPSSEASAREVADAGQERRHYRRRASVCDAVRTHEGRPRARNTARQAGATRPGRRRLNGDDRSSRKRTAHARLARRQSVGTSIVGERAGRHPHRFVCRGCDANGHALGRLGGLFGNGWVERPEFSVDGARRLRAVAIADRTAAASTDRSPVARDAGAMHRDP